jgi:predicted RNase H-like nuclease (RuvC/YqgF family)
MALLMVLTTITIISLAPSFISSITMDRKELEDKIVKQTERINTLESQLDTLDQKLREDQRSCTQELFQRESEFIKMLDEIRSEAYKCKSVDERPKMLIRTNESNGEEPMMRMEQFPRTGSKPDISPILKKIDRMKKEIKKN